MLTVQLVKVLFKLLMATHPTHPLMLFLYQLTCVCLNLQKTLQNISMIYMLRLGEKNSISNEEYKLATNVHRKSKEFNVSEYVMVRIRPERIPKMFSNKLYARAMGPYFIIRKLGSNTYLLDLLNDMDISPIFNVEDFLSYQGTFEPSTLPFSVFTGDVPSLQYSK